MTGRFFRVLVALYLGASLAVGMPAFAQAPAQQPSQAQSQTSTNSQPPGSYLNLLERYNYTKGKRAFPDILAPYTEQLIPRPSLVNSPKIYDLIQSGKLQLSLQDAITLALENDLDIAVAEYTPWIDQTQLLNAEGGGTPLGQFVIGGGGGGTFDPVLFASTSVSDSLVAVNNALQSGVGVNSTLSFFTLENHSTTYDVGYSQELHTGTTFSVTLDNTRSSSTSPENFFNPAVSSSLGVTVSQPLLKGFGLLPNMRFILEARNTDQVGKLDFEEQVITSITQAETQYWTLVSDRQAVDVANQTLTVSQKLLQDDQRQLQIGTLAHLDVVTAESSVASDQQALIAAQTTELQQETVVLNLITKDPTDSRLQGVEIVPTTTLEEAPQVPTIALADAISEAWTNRPELKVDQLTLNNDHIEVRATKNSLLPSLSLSGTYSTTGLGGVSSGAFLPNGTLSPDLSAPVVDSNGNPVLSPGGLPTFIGSANGAVGPNVPGGIGTTYSDIFHNRFPSYSATLQLNMPLRNRSAQAANAQAQLTEREQQTLLQRDKNTIVVSVRQALTAVQQDAALVTADVEATKLAQETYDDEVKKFDLGTSTTYNVVLQSRDLNAAKLNELTAKTSLAIALVNFNQALGRTLSANSISIAGNRQPLDDYTASAPLIPGTIGRRLAGENVFGLQEGNK